MTCWWEFLNATFLIGCMEAVLAPFVFWCLEHGMSGFHARFGQFSTSQKLAFGSHSFAWVFALGLCIAGKTVDRWQFITVTCSRLPQVLTAWARSSGWLEWTWSVSVHQPTNEPHDEVATETSLNRIDRDVHRTCLHTDPIPTAANTETATWPVCFTECFKLDLMKKQFNLVSCSKLLLGFSVAICEQILKFESRLLFLGWDGPRFVAPKIFDLESQHDWKCHHLQDYLCGKYDKDSLRFCGFTNGETFHCQEPEPTSRFPVRKRSAVSVWTLTVAVGISEVMWTLWQGSVLYDQRCYSVSMKRSNFFLWFWLENDSWSCRLTIARK